MSLSLQNSPRRCAVAGSSAHQPRQSRRSQVSESSPRDARDCLSAERRAVQQTLVARRREDVRDDHREQGDRARDKAVVRTFTPSLVVRSLSQRQIRKVSTNRTCSTQRVTQLHTERRSDCVRPERNCDNIERVLQDRRQQS